MSDYYIDGLVGNDSNTGTSEGAGNAWATIGKAVSGLAGGDRVFVKASASYAESPDFSSKDGTASAPIVIEGYGTTVGDGTRAVITSDGPTATRTLDVGKFYSVRNLKVTGGTGTFSAGIRFAASSIAENCEVDGNEVGQRGFDQGDKGYTVGCYAHNCTFVGFQFSGNSSGVFACIADTCRRGVLNIAGTFGYFYCIMRKNTVIGLQMNSASASEPIVNCTVDGVTAGSAKGIQNTGSGDVAVVINCVVINCDKGINMGDAGSNARNWSFNNCLFGNTTDYTAAETVSGEITTDPTFVDESAKDYGPDTGSPLIAGGYDFRTHPWLTMTGDRIDVGALQSLVTGGPNIAAGAFFRWGMN